MKQHRQNGIFKISLRLLTGCYQARSVQLFVFFSLIFLCFAACEPTAVIEEERLPSYVRSDVAAERPDPWNTVVRVIDALERDDTRALWKDIYPLSQERYGESQIIERNAKIHEDLGIEAIHFTNIAPLQTNSKGSQVFYTADTRYCSKYGDIRGNTVLSFIWHPAVHSWQLEWTPSLILPGLSETGVVRIETLPARRGEIFDRSGWPLAIEHSVAEVSVIPQTLDLNRIPEVEQLLGLDPGTVQDKLAQSWVQRDSLVPIAVLDSLREVDYKAFKELNLSWTEKSSRYYPFGEALSPLIGYVTHPNAEDLSAEEYCKLEAEDLIGRSGLEQIYDAELRGKKGLRVYISDSYEKSLVELSPEHGKDLHLTIDALAQRDLYELLAGKDAAISALDPASGEIIILLSSPAYDPMPFVLGISDQEYQSLLAAQTAPLTAKFAASLGPGSTQKLPTAIIALRNGSISLTDQVEIVGKSWQADESWGNYAVQRYREIDQFFDLEDALVFSDNIFFARLAVRMGSEAFNAGMKELGVGEVVCPDYPFARAQISNQGLIAEGESILLADSAYGQGEVLYPQIALARIYATLLNGGELKDLQLILEEEMPSAAGKKLLLTPGELEVLQRAMERVVDEQYPQEMQRNGLALAGKSGTAEIGLDAAGSMILNSWFVGYERDHPGLCLAFTYFNSHLDEDPYAAQVYFADFFQQLYGKQPYKVPQPSWEKRYKLELIPPFEKFVAAEVLVEDVENDPLEANLETE